VTNILLADDDGSARALIARVLVTEGHSVVQADDGQAALDKFLADPAAIDLVVTDVDMPVLDGIELVRRVLAARPTVRVLLISGHAGGLDQAAGLAGANVRVLAKPASIEAIRDAVRALLG
jgi:two-component system cell cycle sensor histidine kinase/response regulator CckA